MLFIKREKSIDKNKRENKKRGILGVKKVILYRAYFMQEDLDRKIIIQRGCMYTHRRGRNEKAKGQGHFSLLFQVLHQRLCMRIKFNVLQSSRMCVCDALI